MALQVMRAIDYNTWMSIIDFISTELPQIGSAYGMGGVSLDVIPSYPKDLTKFHKPSIIVQKVSANSTSIGFGNVLGQYFDEAENAIYDVSGSLHKMLYQINIDAGSNTECSILTSMLTEGIFQRVYDVNDPLEIVLKDYIPDIKHPVDMGRITLDHDLDITDLSSNDNEDYIATIRFEANVVQSIIPQQEMVDLTKGFKYNYKIKL